jgi:hypothetical protein
MQSGVTYVISTIATACTAMHALNCSIVVVAFQVSAGTNECCNRMRRCVLQQQCHCVTLLLLTHHSTLVNKAPNIELANGSTMTKHNLLTNLIVMYLHHSFS